jgi:Protein of unknown function (DUF2752)
MSVSLYSISTVSLSHSQLHLRKIKLALFVSPILISCVLAITGQSSPVKCPILGLIGIPCPGCGLSRAFVAIAQGNLSKSLDYHLFGVLIFLSFCLTCVHLCLEVIFHKSITTIFGQTIQKSSVQILALLVILGYHSSRLYHLWLSGELAHSFYYSPLGQWLN